MFWIAKMRFTNISVLVDIGEFAIVEIQIIMDIPTLATIEHEDYGYGR